jgi:tetratricopeptide (TPR) repeat protein
VLKSGDQLRINAQLIDAMTGYHLWSQRYDRPLKDIFALQDEIVQQIVTTLKLQLSFWEQGILVRKTTDSLEAYDYFLRGAEYYLRLTKETNVQARQMYEKAITLDSQYAAAYALLGWTYYVDWTFHWRRDPQTLERALALAHKAIALDDSLPVAHALLGVVYAQRQQYDQAIAEGERAIALDPNNANAYVWQVDALMFAGRPAEALQRMEQAMRLNPRPPPYYLFSLGWAYLLTGRYAEAVATLQEALNRNPNHLGGLANLASSYALQWASQQSQDSQTLEQALAAAQRLIAIHDASPWGHAVLGDIYLTQKHYERALIEMERAVALAPNEAESYASLAEVLSYVGKPEEALRMVEQALRRRPSVVDGHLGRIGNAYYLVATNFLRR